MVVADTVSNQMYEILKSMILEHKIQPGEKIDSNELARQFNVSVMPVRHALHKLTTQGLVVTQQRVGFFVRAYSTEELGKICDMRSMFELYCIRRYFNKINPSQAKKLAKLFKETPCSRVKTHQALDSELHQMIIAASDNPFLYKQYDEMICLFNMAIYVVVRNTETARQEHLQILESILQGDQKAAEQHLQNHLERAANVILEFNAQRPRS